MPKRGVRKLRCARGRCLELRTNLLRTDSLWPTCQGCTDALSTNVARAEGGADLTGLHLLRAASKSSANTLCANPCRAKLRANLACLYVLRATLK